MALRRLKVATVKDVVNGLVNLPLDYNELGLLRVVCEVTGKRVSRLYFAPELGKWVCLSAIGGWLPYPSRVIGPLGALRAKIYNARKITGVDWYTLGDPMPRRDSRLAEWSRYRKYRDNLPHWERQIAGDPLGTNNPLYIPNVK